MTKFITIPGNAVKCIYYDLDFAPKGESQITLLKAFLCNIFSSKSIYKRYSDLLDIDPTVQKPGDRLIYLDADEFNAELKESVVSLDEEEYQNVEDMINNLNEIKIFVEVWYFDRHNFRKKTTRFAFQFSQSLYLDYIKNNYVDKSSVLKYLESLGRSVETKVIKENHLLLNDEEFKMYKLEVLYFFEDEFS